MAFTMFTPDLVLHFHKFATHSLRANLVQIHFFVSWRHKFFSYMPGNYTIFWLLLMYLLFLCFVFFPVTHLYLFLFIFDIFGGTYVRNNFVHLRQFWRYSRTHESLRLHFLKKRSDASRTRAFTLCTGHSRWRKTIKASIKI